MFKAYASKHNLKLHHQVDLAAEIWNHCIALHRRYYRMYGAHLNQFVLMKHLAKLKRLPKHRHWKGLGSQAIQDVAQRIEKATELCTEYGIICIEDLNLQGMKRLWGRKVSDLGYGAFVDILRHQAMKHGTTVVTINRWFPSSKTCSCCGTIYEGLNLRDRVWTCTCGSTHQRDLNAAINILRAGMSALGLDGARPGELPAAVA